MLTFDATQTAIAASNYKRVSWLFQITDTAGPTTTYWSTRARSWDGNDYSFKILPNSFRGVTMQRDKSEVGIHAPNSLTFSVSNRNNALTASNFVDGYVTLLLVVSDGTNEAEMASWKFYINRCESEYQKLKFTCEDFFQKVLDGDYPNTKLVQDISPSDDPAPINDTMCVPVAIGQPYIPLRSIYITDQRYYLLGEADGKTYSIQAVSSPRAWGSKIEWPSGSYTFTQSTKAVGGTNWRVFQPIIADSNGEGIVDASGIWQQGQKFLDMPTQFKDFKTKHINGSETGTHTGANGAAILTDAGASWPTDSLINSYVVNLTDNSCGLITDNDGTTITASLALGTDNDWDNGDSYVVGGAASVIAYVLRDMGVSHDDFDTARWRRAERAFAGWGIELNGAYFYKRPRASVLAELLNMVNASMNVRSKIRMYPNEVTSRQTLTKADIIRRGKKGEGTFKYSGVAQTLNDSGYVAFQESGEPQDAFVKVIVPSVDAGTTDNIAGDTLMVPFIQDSQDAQRAGTLYFQKRLQKEATVRFTTKGTTLKLEVNDVCTINHADYGGNYDVLIDTMHINPDCSIDFTCTKYAVTLEGWDDVTPGAITIASDDTTYSWQPVLQGSYGGQTAGVNPNDVTQTVRFIKGADLVFIGDSTNPAVIEFVNDTQSHYMGCGSNQNALCIWPDKSSDPGRLRIGYNPQEAEVGFRSIFLNAISTDVGTNYIQLVARKVDGTKDSYFSLSYSTAGGRVVAKQTMTAAWSSMALIGTHYRIHETVSSSSDSYHRWGDGVSWQMWLNYCGCLGLGKNPSSSGRLLELNLPSKDLAIVDATTSTITVHVGGKVRTVALTS